MRNCPACHSDNQRTVGEKNSFQIQSCTKCGSVFTTETVIDDYDEYYTHGNLGTPGHISRRVKDIVATFEPYRQNGRLLDIGFGSGVILKAAEKWERYGVEPSLSAIKNAKPEWNAFHGFLEDAKYPDDHFDVITASEIIEHCPDPELFLREVHRILRPGGLFWATTPAANGISFKVLGSEWSIMAPPEHLQLFSSTGINRLLARVGFKKFGINMHGVNPTELVQKFRKQDRVAGGKRVQSGYTINEALSASPLRKSIKSAINFGLNVTRLGDSLKIRAIK